MKVPEYGRKKVDEIIAKVKEAAEHSVHTQVDPYELHIKQDDLVILADMLYEMDRHLPDFFEEDTEVDDQTTDTAEPPQE